MNKLLLSALLATSLMASQSVQAATTVYNFTTLANSTATLPQSVASLTLADVAGGVKFTLQGDFSWLGSGAYLSQLQFNGPNGTVAGIGGNLFKESPGYGSYSDTGYTFSWENLYPTARKSGSDRFLATDFSTWTINGAGLDVTDFSGTTMLHIQGLEDKKTPSIKVLGVVSAVPEAGTSSMMLLGLGLMAFVARRRRSNLA